MMWEALAAVSIVSLLSLVGAVFLLGKRNTLTPIMTPLLALSSGVLLGSTFFDLIPESIDQLSHTAYAIMLVGIITFFSLEKLLQWHHHTDGDHEETDEHKAPGYLTLIGDGIHNFIDGVVIGGAFLTSIPLGITVTIAIIAHEIPHEMADFTILLHSGFTSAKALWYNFLSATTAIAGTILVIMVSERAHSLIPYLIPFGAGNFLYIAMSDLIPELHRKRSRIASLVQIVFLILGTILMRALPKE